MSGDKWNWKEICDSRPCPGDCDFCWYDDETQSTPWEEFDDDL